MKRTILLLFFSLFYANMYAQTGCLEQWQAAFEKRGSFAVSDDMHRKVYVSFIENGESWCVSGKARVENGRVVSVFLQYEDGTYELMDMKLVNTQGRSPGVRNGISEEIINEENQHFYVIFVEKLKPEQKKYKTVGGPGDF
ncbi:hypothetical protein [Crocinitomix algicola]|uniref:hypothetical protein n=1 Tax=Crocinitomix algicola TaxID=1740263 RepID=UPI000871D397|nr:hypothetical protein [Crocinitomix algicola]